MLPIYHLYRALSTHYQALPALFLIVGALDLGFVDGECDSVINCMEL